MTQEVLKLALEALEAPSPMGQYKAITAIKEALKEHAMREVQRLGQEIEQEPVAYQDTADKCRLETVPAKGGLLPQRTDEEEYLSKAYRLANELRCHLAIAPAPQRTWVGLTDEEMTHTNHHMVEGAYQYSFKQGAKWAEAKLKQKNGYAEEKNNA